MVCIVCDGECRVICPSCSGMRLMQLTPTIWETCLNCDDDGRVKCPECKGIGVIGDDFQ